MRVPGRSRSLSLPSEDDLGFCLAVQVVHVFSLLLEQFRLHLQLRSWVVHLLDVRPTSRGTPGCGTQGGRLKEGLGSSDVFNSCARTWVVQPVLCHRRWVFWVQVKASLLALAAPCISVSDRNLDLSIGRILVEFGVHGAEVCVLGIVLSTAWEWRSRPASGNFIL